MQLTTQLGVVTGARLETSVSLEAVGELDL